MEPFRGVGLSPAHGARPIRAILAKKLVGSSVQIDGVDLGRVSERVKRRDHSASGESQQPQSPLGGEGDHEGRQYIEDAMGRTWGSSELTDDYPVFAETKSVRGSGDLHSGDIAGWESRVTLNPHSADSFDSFSISLTLPFPC